MLYKNILINKPKIVFLIVLAFSFVLRVITIGAYETWDDEKLSVSEANGILNYNFQPNTIFTKYILEKHNTLNNVVLSTVHGDGGNGILYIVCLHYWSNLFGNTDFAVRFFSLIMGVLTVILVYFISIEMFDNKKLSIIVMLLTSIHPQLISYSQEARSYVFALVFTLTSTLILLKLIYKKYFSIKYLFLYMIFVLAAILSHYSTIYIFIAHFLILLFILKIDFKNWVKLFAFATIPVSFILIWLISYGFEGIKIISIHNHHYSELSLHDPSNSFYMKTGLYSISAGWLQNLLTFSGITLVQLGYRILIILPLIIIPFFIIIKGLKKIDSKHCIYIQIIFILFISSLIYATILSLISGHIISFQQSYSIFSTPYFVILMGICIFHILNSEQRKRQYILYIVISLQMTIMIFSTTIIYFAYDSHTKSANNYEFMAEKINTIYSSKNSDLIITYKEKYTAIEVNKYLHENLSNIKQVIDTSITNPTLSILFTKSKKQIVIVE